MKNVVILIEIYNVVYVFIYNINNLGFLYKPLIEYITTFKIVISWKKPVDNN